MVTIDDPEEKRLESDIAFYPPVHQLEKTNWNGFKGELLVGWEYVILRKEFLKQYPKPNNTIPNILVSMGGTDNNDMTQFVVDALGKINKPFSATIILGPGYLFEENLKNILHSLLIKYSIHHNPINIAEIMSKANLAIISFGQTAYELTVLKVPSIYLCLTDDHNNSAQLFVDSNFGKSLGVYGAISDVEIVENVNEFLENYGSQYKTQCFGIPNCSTARVAEILMETV